MMSRKTRLLLAVCLLAGALQLVATARAQDTMVWFEKASEGFVTLAYGPLDPAKPPLLLLSCFDAMGIAVLDVRAGIEGKKPGEPLIIELSAGDTKVAVKGEAALDDTTGQIFAEASELEVKPVLAVFRQSGPVMLKVGEASETLSDQGRADGVEKFSQDCQID
jgi:hypothetical protein